MPGKAGGGCGHMVSRFMPWQGLAVYAGSMHGQAVPDAIQPYSAGLMSAPTLLARQVLRGVACSRDAGGLRRQLCCWQWVPVTARVFVKGNRRPQACAGVSELLAARQAQRVWPAAEPFVRCQGGGWRLPGPTLTSVNGRQAAHQLHQRHLGLLVPVTQVVLLKTAGHVEPQHVSCHACCWWPGAAGVLTTGGLLMAAVVRGGSWPACRPLQVDGALQPLLAVQRRLQQQHGHPLCTQAPACP